MWLCQYGWYLFWVLAPYHLEFEETFQITPSGCWTNTSLFNLLRGGLLKKRNPYIVSTYYFWKVTLLWRLEREFRSCFIVFLTSLHFCPLFLGITRSLALYTLIRLIYSLFYINCFYWVFAPNWSFTPMP